MLRASTAESLCKQVRVMQPMAAGARRSLIPAQRNVAEPPNEPARCQRGETLEALTPDDETPPLQRREFGTEGLRQSTVDDSDGTPAEVRSRAVRTYLEQCCVPFADERMGYGDASRCRRRRRLCQPIDTHRCCAMLAKR